MNHFTSSAGLPGSAWFRHLAYASDAFRFLNGTPDIPAIYAASEGPKIIDEVGVESIRKKSTHQTSLIMKRAEAYGFAVHTPADAIQRGGTVSVGVPFGQAVARELLRREILVH